MTAYDPLAMKTAIDAVRLGLALAAAGLLAWGALAARNEDRAGSQTGRRVRDVLLVAVAALSAAGWWNFGQFHYGGPDRTLAHVHVWDAYHYYVGAKYFDELAYSGLYDCTSAADLESDHWRSVARRAMRDLETNQLVRVTPLATASCKERFSPERWKAFQTDVAWFRARIPNWDLLFRDWGFNATPVWTALGRALAATGAASDGQIRWLTLLDVPLLLIGFLSVAWAFGWRVLCVVLVFWGTNFPAEYAWTGGSFLRHAWFALLLGGLSLLRRGHHFAAGAALAGSTLLRIFPGVIFFGLALLGLRRLFVRAERAAFSRTLRSAAGALITIAVLVPLAAPWSGGLTTWVEFQRNSVIDSVPSANNLGITGIFAHRERDKWAILKSLPSPVQRWEAARADALEDRRLARLLAIALGATLLAAAALRWPDMDWSTAVLAIGIVPILFHLASYYGVVIGALGLLAGRRPWIGVALCLLAAGSQAIGTLEMENDERYVWLTVAWIAFVLFAALDWLRGGRDEPAPAAN